MCKQYVAEAIATFTLIFVGGAAILAGTGTLGIALAHGLAIAVMIYAIGHISGAHINPAVTIAMWATKKIKTQLAAGYIVSQLAGATVAAYFLSMIYGNVAPIVNNLAPTVSMTTGLFVEVILTFFLVFVIFATAVDKSNKSHHAALAIGFVIVFDHIIGLSLTGSSMNPARTFGPALVSGMWTNHLIYWVAPIVGALIAAFVYQYVFLNSKKK